MTREELIETMARATAQQIVIEMMPSFTDAPGGTAVPTVMLSGVEDLPLKLIAAIEAAGLCIVPVDPTASMLDAALEADTWSPIEIWEAMVTAGRI